MRDLDLPVFEEVAFLYTHIYFVDSGELDHPGSLRRARGLGSSFFPCVSLGNT